MEDSQNGNMRQFVCPKCRGTENEVGELHIAGGFWSKLFDVQGSRFTAVTCKNCAYTEMYKGSRKTLHNVLDLFT